MRRIFLLASACLLSGIAIASAADPGLKPGDKVAIIGDSITEQKQYSVYMEEYLLACQPVLGLHTMQFGWSGETAEGFKKRMENDCLRYQPTVATTCYGMNDGKYKPQTPENAKWYHDNQTAVVENLKKAGVHFIVVGSPGCVDTYTFRRSTTAPSSGPASAVNSMAEMYNKTLADERDIAKTVAQEQGVAFADVYDVLLSAGEQAKIAYGIRYPIAGGDGVHPGPNGHLVMAYAFLKALGCDGNIGTITVDLSGNQAQATDGHKVLSSTAGVVELESTRYPFCFLPAKPDAPDSPANVRGILGFFPFNQDLNRLMLVVKNAPAFKMKITWGETSKEYDSADLAKGVNLAADFLDNPFVEPFRKVHEAVREQQAFETPMIKKTIHSIAFPPKPTTATSAPATPQDPKLVAAEAAEKDEQLSAAAIKSVAPVKHTIKIEAVH